jgi:metallo-beta-lactamase class B
MQCTTQKDTGFKSKEVYHSETLIMTQVAAHSYIHTTYKQTNDFGNVPCNGLVVNNEGEALVFDTPTNDVGAEELIKWIGDSLHCRIKGVIPTHFHDDCLGGLKAFHQHGIISYANKKTIELAASHQFEVPVNGFEDSLDISVGKQHCLIRYFGAGHTIDNVVAYYPADRILFGGCLIKESDASKGYLGDADTSAWSLTVQRVCDAFPYAALVVPGHGTHGNRDLLSYTIQLFKSH